MLNGKICELQFEKKLYLHSLRVLENINSYRKLYSHISFNNSPAYVHFLYQ